MNQTTRAMLEDAGYVVAPDSALDLKWRTDNGRYLVSTVQFPFALRGEPGFESMVFDNEVGDEVPLYTERYDTEEQARAGHAARVAILHADELAERLVAERDEPGAQ